MHGVYNLKKFEHIGNKEDIDFERAWLIIGDGGHLESWEIEIKGTKKDEFFSDMLGSGDTVQWRMKTEDDEIFIGSAFVTGLLCESSSCKVTLQGTGPLITE